MQKNLLGTILYNYLSAPRSQQQKVLKIFSILGDWSGKWTRRLRLYTEPSMSKSLILDGLLANLTVKIINFKILLYCYKIFLI